MSDISNPDRKIRAFGDRVSVRGIGDEVTVVLRVPGFPTGTNWCMTYDDLRALMRQMRRACDYLSGARRKA